MKERRDRPAEEAGRWVGTNFGLLLEDEGVDGSSGASVIDCW